MTGKELIIYILSNNLEDEQMFKDGKVTGFSTEEEAAVIFGVGVSTIRVWVKYDMLPSIKIGDRIYIPTNSELKPLLSSMASIE